MSSRINWSDFQNIDCIGLANYGLHRETVSRATGLSENQVSYRIKQVGVRLRDYREGKGPVGSIIFRQFKVSDMEEIDKQALKKELLPVIKKALEKKKVKGRIA